MDANDQFEIGGVHFGEGLVAQDAGVVDQDMDAAPGFLRLGDHFFHLGIFGDIAAIRHGLAASRLDFLDHGERGIGMAGAIARAAKIVDHDFRTAPRQLERIAAAKAAACAGDDGDFVR